jgi:hypothetical protein
VDRVIVARWAEIEKHLLGELASVGIALEKAESDRELWRAQGEARAYRKLLNLPATLTVLREV